MATADVLESTLIQWSDALLALLLFDQTFQSPIRWATNDYRAHGDRFSFEDAIRPQDVALIQHRTTKSTIEQSSRVKSRAEVFTPAWVCKKMTDVADREWFEEAIALHQGDFWEEEVLLTPLVLRPGRHWKEYLCQRRLEITCGEAPYLTARYIVTTGRRIPWERRYGFLDRKLRLLPKCLNRKAWMKWVVIAYQSIYGYEYQGDSLYLARSNLLATFVDAYTLRWKEAPSAEALHTIAEILSWNLWQMDGLSGQRPGNSECGMRNSELRRCERQEPVRMCILPERCRIRNWNVLKAPYQEGEVTTMKFDFIIGNPPYQAETLGDNETFAPPIYHTFLDNAYERADKVLLIHPARFLFNAGSTPKAWNKKMLNDPHVKVVHYEAKSGNVFPNTDIKGGVAITYRDTTKDFGKVGVFTPWQELNAIRRKVCNSSFKSLRKIIFSAYAYHFTEQLYKDYPNLSGCLSKGHDYDLKSNCLERLPQVFFEGKPDDGNDYIQIYGRLASERVFRWIRKEYIQPVSNLEKWKVFVPAANGSGALGEVLTTPIIGEPLIGATETFISIGCFEARAEAEACLKYVKTKFARCLLGVLKITAHVTPEKWQYVPLQDFGVGSDIDWSGSVAAVDAQLYRKYGLSAEEIAFIESHVKEMQ